MGSGEWSDTSVVDPLLTWSVSNCSTPLLGDGARGRGGGGGGGH